VPQQVLQDLQVSAGFVGQGGGAMSQVVQPYRWQPGPVGEFPEPGGGVVRVDRSPVRAGEQVPGIYPRPASGAVPVPLLELAFAVRAQYLHGMLVKGDRPAPGGGLWIALDDLVAGGGAVAFDEQPP
jgi:hypothetical protein